MSNNDNSLKQHSGIVGRRGFSSDHILSRDDWVGLLLLSVSVWHQAVTRKKCISDHYNPTTTTNVESVVRKCGINAPSSVGVWSKGCMTDLPYQVKALQMSYHFEKCPLTKWWHSLVVMFLCLTLNWHTFISVGMPVGHEYPIIGSDFIRQHVLYIYYTAGHVICAMTHDS